MTIKEIITALQSLDIDEGCAVDVWVAGVGGFPIKSIDIPEHKLYIWLLADVPQGITVKRKLT